MCLSCPTPAPPPGRKSALVGAEEHDEEQPPKGARRKAAYSGGLVLEPKKGVCVCVYMCVFHVCMSPLTPFFLTRILRQLHPPPGLQQPLSVHHSGVQH